MSQALTTSIYTIVGSAVLLVFAEFVRGYIVKPSIKVRAHLGTIIDRIIYYQRFLLNSNANAPAEMSDNLRSAATQLRANVKVVLWYRLTTVLGLTPSHAKVESIAEGLTGLANSDPMTAKGRVNREYADHNRQRIIQIGKAIDFDFKV